MQDRSRANFASTRQAPSRGPYFLARKPGPIPEVWVELILVPGHGTSGTDGLKAMLGPADYAHQLAIFASSN